VRQAQLHSADHVWPQPWQLHDVAVVLVFLTLQISSLAYPSHFPTCLQGSRVDINLLGIAADPWIDITPPPNAVVRKDHGPHHPACASEGLIVCHNGSIRGQLGGSTDFMMKVGGGSGVEGAGWTL
jgi:hypothetical protein